MTRVTGDPAQLEAWIAHFTGQHGTGYKRAPGYGGTFVLVDRETGRGTAYSHWDTLAAMNAAEQVAQQDKSRVMPATGVAVRDLDRFDMFVLDRSGELALPAVATQFEFFVSPDQIDQALALTRSQLPELRAQPGYLALFASVNRMTGRFLRDTVWSSPEARASARRWGSEIECATDLRISEWEVGFVEFPGAVRIG